jgi:hypothetical protein
MLNPEELGALYGDARVSIPPTVFDAELNCLQEV